MTDTSLIGDFYSISEQDIEKASDLLTQAFIEDPGFAFTFPDLATREQKMKIVWEMILRDRIRYGTHFWGKFKFGSAIRCNLTLIFG